MNVQEINSAIIRGNLTNDELNSVVDAVKFARAQLAKQAKRNLMIGDAVKFFSVKRGIDVQGTLVKVAQKYATVNTSAGMWKVPLNMLESA